VDFDVFTIDFDVGGRGVGPAAGIVIVNVALFLF